MVFELGWVTQVGHVRLRWGGKSLVELNKGPNIFLCLCVVYTNINLLLKDIRALTGY